MALSPRMQEVNKTLKAAALANISAPTFTIHHREATEEQARFRQNPGSVLSSEAPAS